MNVKGRLASVIIDPPREGIAKPVLHTLIKLAPDRIVYVSCEPTTLARDVKWLVAGGYRHARSTPYDFFPQTYHLESVTLLEKA
jgi:23S rRNA (uracil1939-C5)-methyltransferase